MTRPHLTVCTTNCRAASTRQLVVGQSFADLPFVGSCLLIQVTPNPIPQFGPQNPQNSCTPFLASLGTLCSPGRQPLPSTSSISSTGHMGLCLHPWAG